MTMSHQLSARPRARAVVAPSTSGPIVALCVVAAALLVASGAIHLHLWRGPYRHLTVGHMNTLFIVQWVLCFVGALALLVMRNLIAVLAAAGLMAGTFIGFLITRYRSAGLFGFHLTFSTSDAKWALAIEITATVLLLVTAALMVRGERRRA
jgi:hypothetical protein